MISLSSSASKKPSGRKKLKRGCVLSDKIPFSTMRKAPQSSHSLRRLFLRFFFRLCDGGHQAAEVRSAAAMPAAPAVIPPVNTPRMPFSFTAAFTPATAALAVALAACAAFCDAFTVACAVFCAVFAACCVVLIAVFVVLTDLCAALAVPFPAVLMVSYRQNRRLFDRLFRLLDRLDGLIPGGADSLPFH